MTWKSYAITGAGLLATYLATPTMTPNLAGPVPSSPAIARQAPVPDIQQEAARLQARLRSEAKYREPSRNPFRFGPARNAPRSRAGGVAPAQITVPPSAPAAPEPPFIILSGMASDVVDGVEQRTAILTTAAGVLLVRAGEMVGADYRVRSVDEEAVELESTSDGSLRRLRLSGAGSQSPAPAPQ